MVNSFKDLLVWQKSMELVEKVYHLTRVFPKHEIYGLVSQMRRSAVSIPSNISEGFVRKSNNELRQFLHISLGSLAELETQLILSARLGYMQNSVLNEITSIIEHVGKMITKLRQNRH